LSACTPPPDLVVGFVASLSGPDYVLGAEGRDAAELYVADLNERGGINGRRVRLEIRDYASDNAALPGALRELAAAGVRVAVGAYTSGAAQAALPVLDELGLVLVSPSATAASLSGLRDRFFRTIMSSERDAVVLGDVIRAEGLAPVLILSTKLNAAYAETYELPLLEAGLAYEPMRFRSPADLDYGRIAELGRSAAPYKSVLIVASPLDTGTVGQALALRGLSAPLFASGWAASEDLIRGGGRAVEGLRLVHQIDLEDPALAVFVARYAAIYGSEPGFSAIQTWDAMRFVEEGLKRADKRGQDLYLVFSSLREFSGVGGTIYIDEFGDATRSLYLKVVREGRIAVLGKVE
jgi:branched-chain amino acid transport system substrate-binding protein